MQMLKNSIVLLAAIVGFGLFAAGVCFADAASDLGQADTYVKSGMYSQAEGLCNSIVQNNQGSDVALKAQGKLAAIYIMTGRMSQAESQVDTLINTFRGNAELPAILYGIMGRYKLAREFQRAENLSGRICQEFPSSEQAQRIQLDTDKEQALRFIAEGKYAQAQNTVNSMVASAGNSPAMPAALYNIAREFKDLGRYEEAGRIYQQIVDGYPNSEFTGKSGMALDKLRVWVLIKTGDVNGVGTALEKLITDYNGNDDLPHTVHGAALKLEESGYYEQAKVWYNRVKTDYAGEDVAEMATVDLKVCDIRAMVGRTSYSAVETEINKLISDFPGHQQLPKAVWRVAAEYFQRTGRLEVQGSAGQAREFYRNAAAIWDKVINGLPRSSSIPEACSYSGACYERLGEYDKANACYQKAIDGFPSCRMRWNMIFMAGRNYEKMKQAGTIPAEQADTQTRAMYEKLLAEYPDCKSADYVRSWLNR